MTVAGIQRRPFHLSVASPIKFTRPAPRILLVVERVLIVVFDGGAMKHFRWMAGGVVGACITLLVGFRVEMTVGWWPRMTLADWLLYHDTQVHLSNGLPTYSAPYWAVAGFLIGALLVVLRQRE